MPWASRSATGWTATSVPFTMKWAWSPSTRMVSSLVMSPSVSAAFTASDGFQPLADTSEVSEPFRRLMR